MSEHETNNEQSQQPAPEPTQADRIASRRKFLLKMSKKAAYVAPVVVTLAASKTAFASGSGVS